MRDRVQQGKDIVGCADRLARPDRADLFPARAVKARKRKAAAFPPNRWWQYPPVSSGGLLQVGPLEDDLAAVDCAPDLSGDPEAFVARSPLTFPIHRNGAAKHRC